MCKDVRVALSARLDGEEPGMAAESIDGHLFGCPACAAWLDGVGQVQAAELAQAPDLTEQIMSAVNADAVVTAHRARLRAAAEAHAHRQVLRIAVALAALVQLGLAVPTLVGTFLATEAGPHTGREMASFDIAVAVGFLLAAYRPARARAFVPVALVLAACLAITSGVDVVRGVTGFGHEFGHLVAVAQAGLLWALGRREAGMPTRVPRPRVAGTPR
jgi:predicted anti-sigma-YlaC factor YlaD